MVARVFLLVSLLFFCGDLFAAASKCPFHRLINALTPKNLITKFSKNRSHTMHSVRDAFYPMLHRLPEEASALSTADIQRGIKDVIRENHLISSEPSPGAATTQDGDGSFDQLMNYYASLNDAISSNSRKYQGPALADVATGFSGQFDGHHHYLPRHHPTANSKDPLLAWNNDPILSSGLTRFQSGEADFARAQLYATSIMQKLAVEKLGPEARALWDEERALMTSSTARGQSSQELGPLFTVLEGYVTINQLTSILLADVKGPDRLRVLKKLIEHPKTGKQPSPFIEVVRRFSPGMVGPLTLSGRYFPGAVKEVDGKLVVSPALFALLSKEREKKITEVGNGFIENPDNVLHITGLGCPVSFCADGGESGLQHAAEAYVMILEKVLAEIQRDPGFKPPPTDVNALLSFGSLGDVR